MSRMPWQGGAVLVARLFVSDNLFLFSLVFAQRDEVPCGRACVHGAQAEFRSFFVRVGWRCDVREEEREKSNTCAMIG